MTRLFFYTAYHTDNLWAWFPKAYIALNINWHTVTEIESKSVPVPDVVCVDILTLIVTTKVQICVTWIRIFV